MKIKVFKRKYFAITNRDKTESIFYRVVTFPVNGSGEEIAWLDAQGRSSTDPRFLGYEYSELKSDEVAVVEWQ